MKTRGLILVMLCLIGLALPAAGQVMFGCTGPRGLFGTVSQTDGTFTLIGDPTSGEDGLSGITFDASGRLFGTIPTEVGSELIEINPNNGSLIAPIGPIRDSSSKDLRIVDLATQPGTDLLFGISSGGVLYTIDKSTAVATLIGSTGLSRGGIAFAPDGTLYLATVDGKLARLDPTTAMPIGLPLSTGESIDGLAVRPTDGALFATQAEGSNIFQIDPATGMATALDPPDDFDTSDLAFQLIPPSGIPAPALSHLTTLLVAAALAAFGVVRIARRRRTRLH